MSLLSVGTIPRKPVQDWRLRLWKWVLAGTLLCLFVPMRYTFLKVGLLAGGTALWGLILTLFWNRRRVRVVCALVAALTVGFGVFLLLPGRPYDASALRRQYVRCLLTYRGTLYVWGGGNHLGIDCSGLVERGLIDAEWTKALTTGNPRLAREALLLWWYNRSARALGMGYRNDTYLLRESPSLDTTDNSALQPGDLAVMSDGVHVLAYVGGGAWIEADPAPMRVILARTPRPDDYFFNSPVRLMRWRVLNQGWRAAK